jgi:hypothetical protein
MLSYIPNMENTHDHHPKHTGGHSHILGLASGEMKFLVAE